LSKRGQKPYGEAGSRTGPYLQATFTICVPSSLHGVQASKHERKKVPRTEHSHDRISFAITGFSSARASMYFFPYFTIFPIFFPSLYSALKAKEPLLAKKLSQPGDRSDRKAMNRRGAHMPG
jgi:hypothetical protein